MKMYNPYEGIDEAMGSLEAYQAELETMVLNGKNEKANRYLRGAILEIQHALSDMSDALFEIVTEQLDYNDSDEAD